MNKQFFESVARNLDLRCRVGSDRYCSLVDVENDLVMSIEFYDTQGGVWIWTCQTVVADVEEASPDAFELLKLNSEHLVWCYYAVKSFAEGGREQHSLNLKYSFGTPSDNPEFARSLLVTVLSSMETFALEARETLSLIV